MTFLTHYVHVTKCFPDTEYLHDSNQTELNKFLRLKRTPYDTYANQLESQYAAALDMLCTHHKVSSWHYYKQNPNQTTLNKVLRLKGTPHHTLLRLNKEA